MLSHSTPDRLCSCCGMFLLALVALLSVAAGEPTLKCRPTGFCKCDVEGLASGPAEIDLRSIFEGGSLQTTVESQQVTYTYNGCHAQACGAHQESTSTMAICQTTGNISFGLGQLQNVSFDISGSDPTTNYWLIVATYRNGDTNLKNKTRVSQVRFFYNETFSVPRFHFEEEDSSQPTYFFTVHSNAAIPRRAVASTTSVSVWIIVGLVVPALIIVTVGVALIITWRCHKHRRGYLRLQGQETTAAIQQQQQQMSIDGTMKWTLLSDAS